MAKSKTTFFDSAAFSNPMEDGFRGVVLLNDLHKMSGFMFADWGLPIVRPKALEYSRSLSNALNDKKLSLTDESAAIDELDKCVRENLGTHQHLNQDIFFLVVSYDQEQTEDFSLLFSDKANMTLLKPVETNFSSSAQKFRVVTSYTNALFKQLETSLPGVSCFELRFGDSRETSPSSYTKERVFEETLIFATLGVSGKV